MIKKFRSGNYNRSFHIRRAVAEGYVEDSSLPSIAHLATALTSLELTFLWRSPNYLLQLALANGRISVGYSLTPFFPAFINMIYRVRSGPAVYSYRSVSQVHKRFIYLYDRFNVQVCAINQDDLGNKIENY